MRSTARIEGIALIGLTLFIGLTSVAGGIGLMGGGIPLPLELLGGSPFTSYLVPGLVLLVVGGSALLAATALLRRHPLAAPVSMLAGLMMASYEVVEILVIGVHLDPPLQPLYFGLGVVVVVLAVRLWDTSRPRAPEPAGRRRGGLGYRSGLMVLSLLMATYLTILHPWMMNWGATAEEQRMALPGDEAGTASAQWFTRAITINAPLAEVWPWLLQIGQDRAGFYSHTWLENLFGGDIHNADEIRAEWQQRSVGDRVPMARPDIVGGALGDGTVLTIRALERERMITDLPGRFVLVPVDDQRTRLLLREPLIQSTGGVVERVAATAFAWMFYDPMHFVMEQRMLRGLKERAEGVPMTNPALARAARTGWTVAALGLLALYGWHRHWLPWLAVPVASVIPSYSSTGDLDAALAGFLAIGTTVIGGLALGRNWWPYYLVLAPIVLLVLLLTPDPYVAFGLIFLAAVAAAIGFGLNHLTQQYQRSGVQVLGRRGT
jgi:hypothetical protein